MTGNVVSISPIVYANVNCAPLHLPNAGIGAYCRWADNYGQRISRIVRGALESGMSRRVIARVLREEGVGR